MEGRNVWELFQLLTTKERKDLGPWLQAILNGKQRETLALYRALCRTQRPQRLFAAVFPNRKMPKYPLKDSMFRRVEYQLASMLERYLSWIHLQNHASHGNLFLMRELNRRNARGQFMAKYNRFTRDEERFPTRDAHYYEYLFQLERELHFCMLKEHRRPNPSKFNETFKLWSLHEQMFHILAHLSMDKPQQLPQAGSLPHLIHESASQVCRQGDYPILEIYCVIYRMILGAEIPWETLKPQIAKVIPLGSPSTVRDIFTLVFNYYIHVHLETESVRAKQILHELYRWSIGAGLLLSDGILAWGHFKNLLTVGLTTGRQTNLWGNMHGLKDLLPDFQQEEAFRFGLANYFFLLDDRSSAARMLSRKFSHVYYEASSRLLMLKIRFSNGHRTEMEPEIRSMRLFLYRHPELSLIHRKSLINALVSLELLIKCRPGTSRETLEVKLAGIRPLINREWYLDVIRK
ncbi:hypothetical protein [Pontibacter sp. G13]|uniref:hypothetical protein n=1 Tax=Pontibacter sp. G13 TaxID=3074898 RepID=UPI0028891CC7|nr:hypothetical protein [Pontibacter sp. G13]WNJ21568.1 hypothetical protein RJD25_28950 [Pontibacter sp. G13]